MNIITNKEKDTNNSNKEKDTNNSNKEKDTNNTNKNNNIYNNKNTNKLLCIICNKYIDVIDINHVCNYRNNRHLSIKCLNKL